MSVKLCTTTELFLGQSGRCNIVIVEYIYIIIYLLLLIFWFVCLFTVIFSITHIAVIFISATLFPFQGYYCIQPCCEARESLRFGRPRSILTAR